MATSAATTTVMTPNARIDVSVINDHIKKLTEPLYRKHLLLGMMRKKGRIISNCSGKGFDWRVKFRRATPQTGDDMSTNTFQRMNRYKKAELPWRRLWYGEAISDFEKRCAGGPEALIKLVSEWAKSATDDCNEYFATEIFGDGDSTTTPDHIHGLETLFKTNTGYAAISSSVFVKTGNSDTYAGLYTQVGKYSSDWTGTFPDGTGSETYHFWSPWWVDTTNANHSASTKTWPNTWRECLRKLSTAQQALVGQQPDIIILAPEYLRQAKESLDAKERIEVTAASDAVDLGFKTVNFEGIELAAEYGVSGVGYGVCYDKMELRLLGQSQLFEAKKDYDIETNTDRLLLECYSNMKFESPIYFSKLSAVS